MSNKKFNSDNFLEICERVKKELKVKKDKELIELVETTQPTFSRRKNEENFSIEWAYLISIKTGLQMQWILSGKGPKTLEERNGDFTFYEELEEWARETGRSDNIQWMRNQIESFFPMFKEWKAARGKNLEEGAEFKKQANGGGWK